MFSTQVDFYIDEQNQAIPASIAASYLDEEVLLAEMSIAETRHSHYYAGVQNQKSSNWLWLTATLTGAMSLGALWLSHQPGFTFPFAAATPAVTGATYFSAIHSQGVIVPAVHAVAVPEGTTQPIFSNQASPSADRASLPVATPEDGFQKAQSFANKAVAFSQNAQSIDDWGLVASQWQKAVATLTAISSHHPDYTVAQQKLAEYRSSLRTAQQKANQPIVEAPMPTTTIQVATDVSCRTQSASAASPVVALSEVKFTGDRSAATLVGCITNHTDRPISSIALGYRGSSTAQPTLFQAGQATINIAEVKPGQTLIFRATLPLHEAMSNVKIESVSWNIAGQTEPQSIVAAVDLVR